jgi:hypothetical protein
MTEPTIPTPPAYDRLRYGHPRLGPITETELAAARADLTAQTRVAS